MEKSGTIFAISAMFINLYYDLDSVDHKFSLSDYLIRQAGQWNMQRLQISHFSSLVLHGGVFMMFQLPNTNLIEIRQVSNSFDDFRSQAHESTQPFVLVEIPFHYYYFF
jgi:hypothetical protein